MTEAVRNSVDDEFYGAVDSNGQHWRCGACKTIRQWGFGFPEDARQRPKLLCETCEDTSIHYFAYVGTGSTLDP